LKLGFYLRKNLYFLVIFLGTSFYGSLSFGKILKNELAPTWNRATDSTSIRLLQFYLPALFLSQSVDSEVRDQWKQNQVMPAKVSEFGDKIEVYGIGPLFALSQYLYFDEYKGAAHLRAILVTGAATQLLKYSVQRRRPDGSNNVSFPSGHTSDAFATATALSYHYGWRAAIVAYPVAGIVGLSRIADDKHWFSDVVSGAFLGVWLARASIERDGQAILAPEAKSEWMLTPVSSQDGQFLQLSISIP
jgi:membrane-associated phospholipid phosphatase